MLFSLQFNLNIWYRKIHQYIQHLVLIICHWLKHGTFEIVLHNYTQTWKRSNKKVTYASHIISQLLQEDQPWTEWEILEMYI